jgi:hypothetical protein
MAWYWTTLIVLVIIGAITGLVLAVVLIKKPGSSTPTPEPTPDLTFNYGTGPYTFTIGSPITPLNPSRSFANYKIDPAYTFPGTIQLNPFTGQIFGTPFVLAPAADYKILASDDDYVTTYTATVNITVV